LAASPSASWASFIQGEVIVCESVKCDAQGEAKKDELPDWLPFKPFGEPSTSPLRPGEFWQELIWKNDAEVMKRDKVEPEPWDVQLFLSVGNLRDSETIHAIYQRMTVMSEELGFDWEGQENLNVPGPPGTASPSFKVQI
jgi:hypothetical protein